MFLFLLFNSHRSMVINLRKLFLNFYTSRFPFMFSVVLFCFVLFRAFPTLSPLPRSFCQPHCISFLSPPQRAVERSPHVAAPLCPLLRPVGQSWFSYRGTSSEPLCEVAGVPLVAPHLHVQGPCTVFPFLTTAHDLVTHVLPCSDQ